MPPRTAAVVLIVSVFARPGHALDQEVAAGDEADEHALEHLVLTGDHALDLDERLLELRAVVGVELAIGRGLGRRTSVLLGGGSRSRSVDMGLLVSTSDASGRRAARPCDAAATPGHVAGWLRVPREASARRL